MARLHRAELNIANSDQDPLCSKNTMVAVAGFPILSFGDGVRKLSKLPYFVPEGGESPDS